MSRGLPTTFLGIVTNNSAGATQVPSSGLTVNGGDSRKRILLFVYQNATSTTITGVSIHPTLTDAQNNTNGTTLTLVRGGGTAENTAATNYLAAFRGSVPTNMTTAFVRVTLGVSSDRVTVFGYTHGRGDPTASFVVGTSSTGAAISSTLDVSGGGEVICGASATGAGGGIFATFTGATIEDHDDGSAEVSAMNIAAGRYINDSVADTAKTFGNQWFDTVPAAAGGNGRFIAVAFGPKT